MNDINKFVSVCMITYNHEDYISESIESILNQKTTFPFEIIIGEDCSKDNTRAIVADYASKNQNIIPIFEEKNKGVINNFLDVIAAANGKYIAFCEGDDYWVDPYKLQKQVDFLEANPQYSMCVSNRLVKQMDGEYFEDILDKKVITLEDVLRGQIVHTQTMLFLNKKNELIDFLRDTIKVHKGCDRETGYFYALKGNVYCLPDVTAVYRMSGAGVWSQFSEQEKVWLELEAFYDFHKRLNFSDRKLFVNEFTKKSLDIVYYAWKRKQANPFKWKIINSLSKRLTIAELISETFNYGLCKIRSNK